MINSLSDQSNTRRLFTTVVVAMLVLATACGANDSASVAGDATSDGAAAPSIAPDAEMAVEAPADDATAEDTTADLATGGEAATATDSEVESNDSLALATQPAIASNRDIIRTAQIEVAVVDVIDAGNRAQSEIAAIGGVVFGQDTVAEPEPRTVLVFKVAPENFDEALSRLDGIGTRVNQRVSAEDVTERVVDLQSRIVSAEASVIRLRELLANAGDVEILARLESQLLERESSLESMRGQLRTVQDAVGLATITLTITQLPTVTPPSGISVSAWLVEGHNGKEDCPSDDSISDSIGVDGDAKATLCVDVENIGDAALDSLELTSDGLRLRLEQFDVIEGELDKPLERNGVVRLAYPLTIEGNRLGSRDLRGGLSIRVQVNADVLDDDGDAMATVQGESAVSLFVDAKDDAPGFADSFSGGVDVLQRIASVVVIVAGGLIPFLPFIIIAYLAYRWYAPRRRLSEDLPEPADQDEY